MRHLFCSLDFGFSIHRTTKPFKEGGPSDLKESGGAARGKHILFWRDSAVHLLFNGPDWKKSKQ